MSLSNLFKCTIESDSSWLHLMVRTPNQLVSLKVRSRATQRCPREVLRWDDREGTTSVPVCLAPDRWPRELPTPESRPPPGAHARQGKETVHLVGTRSDLVGRRGRHRCTGGPGCCRCPRVS